MLRPPSVVVDSSHTGLQDSWLAVFPGDHEQQQRPPTVLELEPVPEPEPVEPGLVRELEPGPALVPELEPEHGLRELVPVLAPELAPVPELELAPVPALEPVLGLALALGPEQLQKHAVRSTLIVEVELSAWDFEVSVNKKKRRRKGKRREGEVRREIREEKRREERKGKERRGERRE